MLVDRRSNKCVRVLVHYIADAGHEMPINAFKLPPPHCCQDSVHPHNEHPRHFLNRYHVIGW